MVAEQKKPKKAKELRRHLHTDADATGAGEAASAAPGRLNREPVLCDVNAPPPKWARPLRADRSAILSPAPAVALEMGVARASDMLRAKLDDLCRASRLPRPVRPLTFERWRWAAKWEEDGLLPKSAGHPVLPGAAPLLKPSKENKAGGGPVAGGAAGAGAGAATGGKDAAAALAEDLMMQGLMLSDARAIALELKAEAATLAKKRSKERQQAASGKGASLPPLEIEAHRHSVDLR